LAFLAMVSILAGACSNAGASQPAGSTIATVPSASAGGPTGAPVALTVGLGYIPSVQFAPFYLAQEKGYYAAEGVAVTFQNEIDANLVPKVGGGQVDLGLSDGTSVIPAVSQGVPIRYLATVYGTFPSIVFTKASSGIKTAADLKGKRIGIPGKYGSSWVMLQALLGSANLKPADVTIVAYPDFGQGAALAQGAIDAATGFVNNEPVQLELSGTKATILTIDQITPLPGPGLITGVATIGAKKGAINGFVKATLKAMNEIRTDPKAGLDAAIQAVPELGKSRDAQGAVLAATIAAWSPAGAAAGAPLTGAIDVAGWDASIAYLTTIGLVPKPVTSADMVDASFTSGS